MVRRALWKLKTSETPSGGSQLFSSSRSIEWHWGKQLHCNNQETCIIGYWEVIVSNLTTECTYVAWINSMSLSLPRHLRWDHDSVSVATLNKTKNHPRPSQTRQVSNLNGSTHVTHRQCLRLPPTSGINNNPIFPFSISSQNSRDLTLSRDLA